ncbi:hypothetical protein SDJN03_15254, partial [Cucurbita argyrosperma subsp. sororia]
MALFVFFHSFLELHLPEPNSLLSLSKRSSFINFCGSIKLWEDTDKVNEIGNPERNSPSTMTFNCRRRRFDGRQKQVCVRKL